MAPLVTDASGNALTDFLPASAPVPSPLPCSLVVLRSGPRLLLVFDRHRAQWELPGGGRDPGETPLEAAVRELREESGEDPAALLLAGYARFRLAPDRRVEHAAIFTGELPQPGNAFTPTPEISACLWWDESTPPPDAAQPLDLAIARLARLT